jgi:tetratricopeptide (TPR) repeat protein
MENAEAFDIEATLSPDGVLTGKVRRDVQGDSEIIVRSVFRKVPPAQWKQVVQGMSAYSGFGGTVDNVKVTTPEDLNARFTISYDYERKDYGGFKDGYTSPALPSMLMMNPADMDKRKKPIVMATGKMEATSKIKMPPGATLRAPEAKDLVEDFAEYHGAYRFEGGTLYAKRSLLVKEKLVEPAQFEAFRKFLKAVQDDRGDQIALNLFGGGTLHLANPNKEAIELFDKSRDAFRMGTPFEAIKHLKKLVEVDPDYPNAWGMLGSAYLMTGQKEPGIEALRKQIEKNPKDQLGYKILGEYYARNNLVPQAIEIWKEYLKNNPDDADVKLTIARLHSQAKHYPEAGAIYAELLKAKPDDASLMLESASVRMAGGETEPAFATFQDVLKRTSTANQKNNVAYMLIEKRTHLDDAMKWAEEAVREVEGKSSRIDLAEVTMEDNATTITLAMYWDTLGWGYFQAGDFVQAAKYLQAASTVLEDPVIVEHLAEALEKTGAASKATDTYALAASLGSGPSSTKAMSRLRVLAPGRAEALKGQAASRSSMMRTFKVSGPTGVKSVSSGDVLLLIAEDGKIADVKWLQDSPLAKADAQLRALDLRMHFPSERPAKVLRRGIYMCSSITGCNLTLLTPNTVQSVD